MEVPKNNEEIYQNSNFVFEKEENSKYAKTSTGEEIPFKIFSANNNDARPHNLRESNHSGYGLSDDGVDSPMINVERQYAEFKQLDFEAGTKINNANDVAWLFRNLEDEAVEHLFALYKFKDNSYFVQHLSSGGVTSAIMDSRVMLSTALKLQPDSITLVHNHPSGRLTASREDKLALTRLKNFFENTDIKIEDGVIINLRSGNYLVFNEHIQEVKKKANQNQEQKNVKAYSFSKQVFYNNFQPVQITSPHDVAKFITSQKFGTSDKTELLVLDNKNEIVGKFILPQTNPIEKTAEYVSQYGGTAAIIYGNNITAQMFNEYKDRLAVVNITVLDGIQVKSENGYKLMSFSQDQEMKIPDSNNRKVSEDAANYSKNLSVDSIKEYFSEKDYNKILENYESAIVSGNQKLFEKADDFLEAKMKEDVPEIFFKLKERFESEASKKIFAESKILSHGLNDEGHPMGFLKPMLSESEKNQLQIFINNQNTNTMSKEDFDQLNYLKDQLKYLGFGESKELHQALENGINSPEKSFELKTVSDKTLPWNKVEFTINFDKSEQGGVFLNSYSGKLTNKKGEERVHSFAANRFTAKEAVNLLEGRAVKTEFKNKETGEKEPAFVKLNFKEEKNKYGNYTMDVYNKNYGVDTQSIVEKSGIKIDKSEYKDNIIKSLEKGNVVKVKFEHNNATIEGKAVLNPQYKNISFYDSNMNRINTNKPLQGLEQEDHDKAQVKQQSIKRGH